MDGVIKQGNRIDPFAKRKLGLSDLRVPQLGFGAGTLGDPNVVTTEEQAMATIDRAYDLGIRYFDTSPWYGLGKSETRLGEGLRKWNRSEYLINSKIGRLLSAPEDPNTFSQNRWKGGLPFEFRFDYTYEGVERSLKESLMRLNMSAVDALAVHDLDFKFHGSEEKVCHYLNQLDGGGGFECMLDKKRSGEIKAIGVGLNQTRMLSRFLDRFEGIDYLLVAMPYTLLDQSFLDEGFQECAARGISVILGAVFATGILATGATETALFNYLPAERAQIEKVRRIESICSRFEVPIGAAALQFPFGHPVVSCVIPGANSPEIVSTQMEWIDWEIPEQFWLALKREGLLREDAPTP